MSRQTKKSVMSSLTYVRKRGGADTEPYTLARCGRLEFAWYAAPRDEQDEWLVVVLIGLGSFKQSMAWDGFESLDLPGVLREADVRRKIEAKFEAFLRGAKLRRVK